MDDPPHRANPGRLNDRLAAGEETAFAELFDLLGDRLYRAARRMLTDPHDAEDVVQELFVALVRGRTHLGAVDDLPAYVFSSLLRLAAKARSRRSPTVSLELAGADTPQPTPAHSSDFSEELTAALAKLPEEQRAVVALKIDGELTFAQIAVSLGISPNTAASRWRYAMESLRKQLTVARDRP